MNYLVYNKKSDNGHGCCTAKEKAKELAPFFEDLKLLDSNTLNLNDFSKSLTAEDILILCGGDGTINYFINNVEELNELPYKFYFIESGTGNDFVRDLVKDEERGIYHINEVVKFLPTVEVKGKKYRFINGIGFGIDGECCRVAEEQKAAGVAKIDYTAITIKLLLFKYKRPKATVILDDGEEKHYKKVYLASVMNGQYYGGGMQVAPEQQRRSGELSFVVFSGPTRLGALMAFPSIFKGELVKKTKVCQTKKCKKATVKFSIPTTLQIDGEVVKDVTEYTVTVGE